MKEFLLETFFKNEFYAGWRNIAEELIEKGECIVAGKDCIWKGGIGNFIKTEEATDFIDCIKYKFDYNTFVSKDNLYFMEYYTVYKISLEEEIRKLNVKLKSIEL